jgi:hypothetical protein
MMDFDFDEAEERFKGKLDSMTVEQKDFFQKGYLSSAADAIASIDSVMDTPIPDAEKIDTLKALVNYMRLTIQLAELATGEKFFS